MIDSSEEKTLPLVSVLILSYNHERYIKDCLDSILYQTYPNIELIIMDDASTDGTADVIECYRSLFFDKGISFHFIRNENNCGNISKNCNALIDYCNGKFIRSVAGDDCLPADSINIQVDDAMRYDCTVIYGNQYIVGDSFHINDPVKEFDRTFDENIKSGEEDERLLDRLIYGNTIPAPTVLYAREVFERNGLFNETIAFEDYEYMLRICTKEKFYYDNQCLVYYRRADESFTNFLSGHREEKIWRAAKADLQTLELYIQNASRNVQLMRWEKYARWYYQLFASVNSLEGKEYIKGIMKEKKISVDFEFIDKQPNPIIVEAKWNHIKGEMLWNNYLKNNAYSTVGIYGYGDFGKRLYNEMKKEGISIQYIIDQRAHQTYFPVEAYSIKDELPNVDCIIVTPAGIFEKVNKELKAKTGAEVVDLCTIIMR